ncbi:MAG TPA: hypothetical protein VFD03_06455 [Clostridia bacterium]|nr:hypothetical protein [Clostridia bacterium]
MLQKATLADVMFLINSLSPIEQDKLKIFLLESKAKLENIEQLISAERFTG